MVVDLGELARRMLANQDARTPGELPGGPIDLTTDEAYALQAEIARLREQRGERIIGYKVGCTSRPVREQLGADEPIWARLFDTGCHPSGARLACADFANLAIEGELAIRLSCDLPSATLSDEVYADAVGSVFPVIELHHNVLPPCGRPVAGLIASGGMHAGLILPAHESSWQGRIPNVSELAVMINDRLVGSTNEPWTMGGPVATLRWLSARLAAWGLRLQSGQVILTGSALPLFPVRPGSRVVAESRPLGSSHVEIV